MANKRKTKKRRKSVERRVSAALTKYLNKLNPAFKRASHTRVQKLKDGSLKFKPVFK